MTGRAQDPYLDRDTPRATEADRLPVRERRRRPLQLEAFPRRHEVGHRERSREGRPAAHVVGVHVGVEDVDDPRSPLGHEALVPLDVPARVHDHRLAARDDHVGEAPLATAVDLPELVAGSLPRREGHPHRFEVEAVRDHAALDVLRGDARLAEHVHDHLGRPALGAQHHDLAVVRDLRDGAARVFDEVEVGHVDDLHRPAWLDLPALELLVVSHVEEQDPVAAVEARQELPDLHRGDRGTVFSPASWAISTSVARAGAPRRRRPRLGFR